MKKFFSLCLGLFCLLVVLPGIIGLIIAAFSSDDDKPPAPPDYSVEAYNFATQTFIPRYLKAPSTAKFSSFGDTEISHTNDIYQVSGTVDAQNAFGAMLRDNFWVELQITATNENSTQCQLLHMQLTQGDVTEVNF